METILLPIDPTDPDPRTIARAAELLREGGLVAFPTETVYGLGADALNADAVAAIYEAKGRPAHNPIIVHAGCVEDARRVAADWPADADRLASACWPGPLTLVLPKAANVPPIVTAGGPTIAVRVPAHRIALALIRATGSPLAAPSANRSGLLSPTRAEHVQRGLSGRIPMILDGGATAGGLESTVLDLTSRPPRILRPGLVSAARIESIIGCLAASGLAADSAGRPGAPDPLRSPGMLDRHYAPRAPVELVNGEAAARKRVGALRSAGQRVGWLALGASRVLDDVADGRVSCRAMPADADQYAASLYAALHDLDADADHIVVELPPDGPEWSAIHDRLRRAAATATAGG